MNPNNIELTDIDTLRNSWKIVSSKQSVCAFYMERDEGYALDTKVDDSIFLMLDNFRFREAHVEVFTVNETPPSKGFFGKKVSSKIFGFQIS